MRIVVAPDKFKGSLGASDVANALADGLRSGRPDADVHCLPVADGGEGTLDAAVAAGFDPVPVTVSGPTGEPVITAYARRGEVAVVELADACGLGRLPGRRLRPLEADSRGLGELVASALDAGCRHVVVGIGGSASTDGGAGMLAALGARIVRVDRSPVTPGGAGLTEAARLDLSGLHPALAGATLVVASDVDNPLTGTHGAAAVYGPQKGATISDVAALEKALGQWADLVAHATGQDLRDRPGAGAAGGVGFGAMAVLGARLTSGITTLLELLDFDRALEGADLVITGEGSLDAQSLHGKAPVGVAAAAARAGVPVVAVCGRLLLSPAELAAAGFTRAWSLADREPDPALSMANARALLAAVGHDIAATKTQTPAQTL